MSDYFRTLCIKGLKLWYILISCNKVSWSIVSGFARFVGKKCNVVWSIKTRFFQIFIWYTLRTLHTFIYNSNIMFLLAVYLIRFRTLHTFIYNSNIMFLLAVYLIRFRTLHTFIYNSNIMFLLAVYLIRSILIVLIYAIFP